MAPAPSTAHLDPDSREWLRGLRAAGADHDAAVGRLHALLLGAARFEVARRHPTLPHLRGDELPDSGRRSARLFGQRPTRPVIRPITLVP